MKRFHLQLTVDGASQSGHNAQLIVEEELRLEPEPVTILFLPLGVLNVRDKELKLRIAILTTVQVKKVLRSRSAKIVFLPNTR